MSSSNAKPKRKKPTSAAAVAAAARAPVGGRPAASQTTGLMAHRLFRVARFVLRMVDDRGWTCSVRAFLESEEKFVELFSLLGEKLTQNGVIPCLTLRGRTRSRRPCVVIFGSAADGAGFNKEAAVYTRDHLLVPKTAAVILVLAKKATPQALQTLKAVVPRLWTFTHHECLSDFMRNVGSSNHYRVTGTERGQVLKYSRPHQLPKMPQTDNTARYFGFCRGTIVGIDQNQDVGPVKNYRLVTSATAY